MCRTSRWSLGCPPAGSGGSAVPESRCRKPAVAGGAARRPANSMPRSMTSCRRLRPGTERRTRSPHPAEPYRAGSLGREPLRHQVRVTLPEPRGKEQDLPAGISDEERVEQIILCPTAAPPQPLGGVFERPEHIVDVNYDTWREPRQDVQEEPDNVRTGLHHMC